MRIKDWEKYQHKNGGKKFPWIKLYRDILDDQEFYEISGDSARLLVYLWLLASEKDGVLPDIKKISFRLRMSEQAVTQGIKDLVHWIETDETTQGTHRVHNGYPESESKGVLDQDIDTDQDTDKIDTNVSTAKPVKQSRIKGTTKKDWKAKASETHMFEAFNAYPRVEWRGNPKDCQSAWDKAAKDEGGYDVLVTMVLKHLQWWDRQYIPKFTKYLEERYYAAEPQHAEPTLKDELTAMHNLDELD